MLLMLLQAAISVEDWSTPRTDRAALAAAEVESASQIGNAIINVRVDANSPAGSAKNNGGLSGYMLPFEIVSIHLLVVLVGAAFLAPGKTSRTLLGRLT